MKVTAHHKADVWALTPREALLASLRGVGLRPVEIARELGIKRGSVDMMLARVKEKMQ